LEESISDVGLVLTAIVKIVKRKKELMKRMKMRKENFKENALIPY
jgi:hypothetical protein